MDKTIWVIFILVLIILFGGFVWWFLSFEGFLVPASNSANNADNNSGNNINNNPADNSGNTSEVSTGVISPGKSLDLSGKNLTKIPDNIFSQTDIQILDVSNNKLTGAIQAEIRQLANLRILNASNNLMTGVPAEIGSLQKLEILDLSNNRLTGLPYELRNLKNLKLLDLSQNQYSQQDLDNIKSKLPATTQVIAD